MNYFLLFKICIIQAALSYFCVFLLYGDCSASESGKHLFILAGQSNMGGLNPKKVFQPLVEEAFGENNCLIVKDAEGGQSILRWHKGWNQNKGGPIPVDKKTNKPAKIGDIYERLISKVRVKASNTILASVTLCWMQGESDTYKPRCDIYRESFLGLINQLEKDLQREDIHVVIGRISDARMHVPEWVKIRQVQMELAEGNPKWTWVNTDDCNDGPAMNGKKAFVNDIHYSDEGRDIFARRMAERAIDLINQDQTKASHKGE